MRLITSAVSLLVFALTGANGANEQIASVEEFVKIRCSLDGKDTFYTWSGSIYLYLPQQKPLHALEFIGYNVARCEKINDDWALITREISYYLDPKTKQRVDKWVNPYTKETVDVVHVANNPVNNPMGPVVYSVLNAAQDSVMAADIPLYYPNPLYGNASYASYGGTDEFYEAGEFFKFYFRQDELKSQPTTVNNVAISWSRIQEGFLPWMKMGNTAGTMFYSCSGAKAEDLSGMPKWLVADISKRLPLFLHAPKSYNPDEPNETSQTYFMENFNAYLQSEEFPIAAPDEL